MISSTPAATIRITLVTAAGCHFCDDAHQVLAQFAADDPTIEVETIEAQAPAGAQLLAQHRAPMNPLVLVDGCYFSAGRLPRRKLEALLARRTRAGVAHHG